MQVKELIEFLQTVPEDSEVEMTVMEEDGDLITHPPFTVTWKPVYTGDWIDGKLTVTDQRTVVEFEPRGDSFRTGFYRSYEEFASLQA